MYIDKYIMSILLNDLDGLIIQWLNLPEMLPLCSVNHHYKSVIGAQSVVVQWHCIKDKPDNKLLLACHFNYPELVDFLLDYSNVSFDVKYDYFRICCRTGNIKLLEKNLDIKMNNMIARCGNEYDSLTIDNKKYEHWDPFVLACINGHIPMTKWLIESDMFWTTIYYQYDTPFAYACRYGNFEMAKWLISLASTYGEINIHSLNEASFREACKYGHIDIAKWLISLENTHGMVNIHVWNDYAFKKACVNGHTDIVKWLKSLETTHGKFNVDLNDLFRICCEKGYGELVQYIYSIGDVDIHAKSEYAFRISCENGYINLAKWLWELDGKIDVHELSNHAFNGACLHGHFEIAKWLWSLSNHANFIDHKLGLTFIDTCANGHLEMAQWLLSLYKFNIHANYEYAFRMSCANGHMDMAKWLISLESIHGKIDIHAKSDYAFRMSSDKGHMNVAQWLLSCGGVIP